VPQTEENWRGTPPIYRDTGNETQNFGSCWCDGADSMAPNRGRKDERHTDMPAVVGTEPRACMLNLAWCRYGQLCEFNQFDKASSQASVD
jgi:hypothetical protein